MSKSSKPTSEIDRLIELASDERTPDPVVSPASTTYALSLEDQKDPRPSMWRVLLQLRVLLPYLAKVLPLVERGLLGTNITGQAASVDTSHLDRSIAATQSAQRDISSALLTQTADIKYLQEQITWLSKSIEKETLQQEEMAASLRSMKKSLTIWAILIVVLLVALIGMIGFMLLGHIKAG